MRNTSPSRTTSIRGSKLPRQEGNTRATRLKSPSHCSTADNKAKTELQGPLVLYLRHRGSSAWAEEDTEKSEYGKDGTEMCSGFQRQQADRSSALLRHLCSEGI